MISGNTVRPQPRLPFRVGCQNPRIGTQGTVGIEQHGKQLLEAFQLRCGYTKLAQLIFAVSLSLAEGLLDRWPLVISTGESQRLLLRTGRQSNIGQLYRRVRSQFNLLRDRHDGV